MAIDDRVGQAGSGVRRDLRDALAVLAATPRLLVALDFDGTLAPVVDDPEKARATPEASRAVERLIALADTRVALVSGRALKDLEQVAPFGDEVLLVGSHGIELRLDEADDVLALDADERQQLGVLEQVLDQMAGTLDSVWIEPKPAGFAVHTRLASERHSRVAHLVAINELKAEAPDATVRLGKDVIEFSVRSTTKGEAVEHLRRYTHASAVFYAGDDVTDEDAFVALTADDLGLKSGVGPTAADHRVAGPAEVASVLSLLATLREAHAADAPDTN
ncbi:trehalose-phosphatase [Amnibacterium kyonggiense]|uniref:Trehalose 6-phosphate phosphatase n=1 Tax=Amnibacterium kyonggiense TaxID=595671 RepID=A0A4V6Q0Y4_9MICO|nr:trehalose-phosphatase [Amnibacterium kyonggiense]TDS76168.1 trehalose 6-phosphatase [Amnibacterium kyonggiense]